MLMASADSKSQGLAESQEIPDEEFEDPAHAWIDLCVAFKSGDPSAVRNMLNLAKASKWTPVLYDEMLDSDPDYSAEEDADAAAAASMRSLKQADIDTFFEE